MSASEPTGRLIQEYAEAASAHGEATAAGDDAGANQAHEVVAAIYRRSVSSASSDGYFRCWSTAIGRW